MTARLVYSSRALRVCETAGPPVVYVPEAGVFLNNSMQNFDPRPGLSSLAGADTVLCRCEDVTQGAVDAARTAFRHLHHPEDHLGHHQAEHVEMIEGFPQILELPTRDGACGARSPAGARSPRRCWRRARACRCRARW